MNFYKEVKSSEASKVFVFSHSVVSDSLPPHGLQPTRLLCPWDSSGKNTRVGSHFLLQRIFPTQGSNTALPHCRGVLYQLNHRGSPGKSLLGRKEGVWMGTGAVSVTEARPCGGLGHLVGAFLPDLLWQVICFTCYAPYLVHLRVPPCPMCMHTALSQGGL